MGLGRGESGLVFLGDHKDFLGEERAAGKFETLAQRAYLPKVELPLAAQEHGDSAFASEFGDQIPLRQAFVIDQEAHQGNRICIRNGIVLLLIAFNEQSQQFNRFSFRARGPLQRGERKEGLGIGIAGQRPSA